MFNFARWEKLGIPHISAEQQATCGLLETEIKNKYTYIFVLCKCIMVIHFLKHLVLFSVRLLINWTVKSVSGLLLIDK